MKEKPKQVIDYEKNIIDKDKFEVVITKYYIIPYIDGRIKGKLSLLINNYDLHDLGISNSKMVPLEKLGDKNILPNKTIAFKIASKIIRRVYNNNKELLSVKKEFVEYNGSYFAGKNFEINKLDPSFPLTYFNSQTNNNYAFRLGLNKERKRKHYTCEESSFDFKPTLLEKLTDRIL
ncbi:MAG: hypothetical protein PHQ62_02340 [Clostridia bacterium]|nr:hypothetical protein [Clostridia bacterium]